MEFFTESNSRSWRVNFPLRVGQVGPGHVKLIENNLEPFEGVHYVPQVLEELLQVLHGEPDVVDKKVPQQDLLRLWEFAETAGLPASTPEAHMCISKSEVDHFIRHHIRILGPLSSCTIKPYTEKCGLIGGTEADCV